MADNVEKRFAAPSSPEGAPSLRAVKVKANTVGEAMDKAGGAGQAELDWVLANPEEARKMLKGHNWFYFPDAADGDYVPYVPLGRRRVLAGLGPSRPQVELRRPCRPTRLSVAL